MTDETQSAFDEGYRRGLDQAAAYYDKGQLNGYARGKAEEREACASLAQKIGMEVRVGPGGDCAQGCQGIADEIAAAIRARGQQ